MPTQKQRREAARRHLERQLQRRAEQEASRKRFTLIASIVGTVVLIAVVIVAVVLIGGNDNKKSPSAKGSTTPASASVSPSPSPTPSKSYPPAKGAAVTFSGVTVTGAKDLAGYPTIKSKASKDPAKVLFKDLVVGKGKAATATSSVTIQYVGVLYKNGKLFDSSWQRGQTATFSLSGVIKGFTQGIAGTTGVPPMKVGGRRLMILPSKLAYGAQSNSSIPANSPLVFVVDLKSLS